MTMIEKAARALKELDLAAVPMGLLGDEETGAFYRSAVRAVLQAIREPSDAMIDAGHSDETWDEANYCTDAIKAYTAMIDAALKE